MNDDIKIDLNEQDIEYLQMLVQKDRRKNSKTKVDNFMKSRIDIELERLKVLARKYEEKGKINEILDDND